MHYIRTLITELLQDESGQDLIEYALLAALIGLGAVAAVGKISGDVSGIFNSIATQLSSAIL